MRAGYQPSAVRAHHDAPSSWVAAASAVVELRGYLRHLGFAEHSSEVQEARFGQEVSDLLRVVVDPEATTEVERAAVAVAEVDRARFVDGPAVESRRAAPAPRPRNDRHFPAGTSRVRP